MKLSKWTYERIAVAILLAVSGGIWYGVATKDERVEKAELESLIKFAQRQALEIAIIEQGSKLMGYRQQMAAAQQKTRSVSPPLPAPFVPPAVVGPTDVNR